MLERLFGRADADKNGTLDASELAGLMGGNQKPDRAAALIARHDQDDDQLLSLAEVTGARLAPDTMSDLLTVQEYAAASRLDRRADDQKAVDAFFAQADLDGNGALSREEYDAGRMLGMAEGLDTGAETPQHMFVVSREALADSTVGRDEIMVARRLVDVAKPMSLDDPDLDPEVVDLIKNLPKLETPDAPTEATPSMADTVKNADFTQALVDRLIRMLEQAHPGASTTSLTV